MSRILNPDRPRMQHIPAPADSMRVFCLDGRRVAYDPLSMALYRLNPIETPPPVAPFVPQIPPRPFSTPRYVVLSLTHGCNLGCDYCYVRNELGGDARMTKDTVVRALELFKRPPQRFGIGFFGGEPLSCWDRLVWATERAGHLAEAAGARCHMHVTTNGTLLDEHKIEFLNTWAFSMIVSVDGPPEIHDRHRRHTDGTGSWSDVRRGLDLIKQRRSQAGRTTLRGTWMPDEEPRIAERLAFMNELCEEGCATNVALEAAIIGAHEGCPIERRPYAPGAIARAIAEGARWCIDQAREGRRGRWAYLWKTIQRLMGRAPSGSECAAARGYIAVNAAGEIHACHKETSCVGYVHYGLDEPARLPWLENRWYAQKRCPTCWARNACGGPCRADMVGGVQGIPDSTYCMVRRSLIVEAIRAIVELEGDMEKLELLGPGLPEEKKEPRKVLKCASGC